MQNEEDRGEFKRGYLYWRNCLPDLSEEMSPAERVLPLAKRKKNIGRLGWHS